MANAGSINVDVKVTGYWQLCPVCTGCGTVPADFYNRLGSGTSCARERCRRCVGTGTIETPAIVNATATTQKPQEGDS